MFREMEKLLNLLNEYDSDWGVTDYWALFNSMNEWISGTEDLQVISKKFWFIKWLVENEKVDFEWKLNTLRFNSLVDQTLDSYYALLMLLSIQDEPISFLISILK